MNIIETNVEAIIQEGQAKIFVHTPFCGTCQLAEKMLQTVEAVMKTEYYHKLNASLFPDFMQQHQIESVPCLITFQDGQVKDKTYAFQSVQHMLAKTISE
ncbi:thioredoxin family protein [Terribacillus sp. DMT04]|uniref:thioredoxin family protein n=1 Tax=Terribacillus sp. DMT04 TaxID=2850441 RepID=UPI001C2C3A18|nr:thioredoxin family protein [Terribacillus sp. DMT04]